MDFIETLQRNGVTIQERDFPIGSFYSIHILISDITKFSELSDFEVGLVGTQLQQIADAYVQLADLSKVIATRLAYEKKKGQLPPQVRGRLTDQEGRLCGDLDFDAADMIYGDALWDFLFHRLTIMIKGVLGDYSNPEELLRVSESIFSVCRKERDRILAKMESEEQHSPLALQLLLEFDSFPEELKDSVRALSWLLSHHLRSVWMSTLLG